ncbi:SGNH/GDSL hydrolase family protein [Neptunicella sp. SCSIO 80796]|uniref:SGNH/GDSL hydrolase family protein n=1 Tax=Neptunicella plasticusilytica TaxID=3117012 RepID=UPI003A4DA9F5
MQLNKSIGLLLICLVWGNAAFADNVRISPDNNAYIYTGRIDFSDPRAPLLSWPGTSIKANFSGTALSVILDDDQGKNFFNVIIDGDDRYPYVIQAEKGEKTYWLSDSLGEGKHSVEIYKRTEGEEGNTAFKGLVLAEGQKLLPPPMQLPHKIEIYGDSITSGMGNEGAYNGADDNLSEKNNYLAYGSIAARQLDAELHTISQSGIGIMVSWFPFIMPQFYDQLSAVGNNDSQWDFSQWTPDVVLINLFQNDSWLVEREGRMAVVPDEQQRVEAYIDFVRSIRQKYPEAEIICALGSMDATRKGSDWPDYLRQAVETMRDKFDDQKLSTLFFDFNGYGQHPRVAQHQANADKLTHFIQQKMHW